MNHMSLRSSEDVAALVIELANVVKADPDWVFATQHKVIGRNADTYAVFHPEKDGEIYTLMLPTGLSALSGQKIKLYQGEVGLIQSGRDVSIRTFPLSDNFAEVENSLFYSAGVLSDVSIQYGAVLGGEGKFRFNLPVGDDDSRWFIGTGTFDEVKSEFTGNFTLDFEHHWAGSFKDYVPKNRLEVGSNAIRAWNYGSHQGTYGSCNTVFGAAALPISNVTRLDLGATLVASHVSLDIHAAEESLSSAVRLAIGKVGHVVVDSKQSDRVFAGPIIGQTPLHTVLSLGREAAIFVHADLSRVPGVSEANVVVDWKGGKGVVAAAELAAVKDLGR